MIFTRCRSPCARDRSQGTSRNAGEATAARERLRGTNPTCTVSPATASTTPSASRWPEPPRSTAGTLSCASCWPAAWPAIPEADIEDAQQLWYVCQATYSASRECTAVEQRYFVTSIPEETLTRDQELALVRMHWSVENGCHWTMDVILGEDDAQPCQANKASIETVSWLRIIGFNAVSAWRQQAPRMDRMPI